MILLERPEEAIPLPDTVPGLVSLAVLLACHLASPGEYGGTRPILHFQASLPPWVNRPSRLRGSIRAQKSPINQESSASAFCAFAGPGRFGRRGGAASFPGLPVPVWTACLSGQGHVRAIRKPWVNVVELAQ